MRSAHKMILGANLRLLAQVNGTANPRADFVFQVRGRTWSLVIGLEKHMFLTKKDASKDASPTNPIDMKKLEKQFYVLSFFGLLYLAGPGFFNYFNNLINPIKVFETKTEEGIATVGYYGKGSTLYLRMGGNYYNCGQGLEEATKGCKGINKSLLESPIKLDFIELPWNPASSGNRFPVSIKNDKSGDFVELINSPPEFINYKLKEDLNTSIFFVIFQFLMVFFIIKSINYLIRKFKK